MSKISERCWNMSYFKTWQKKIEDTTDPNAYNEFVQDYYLKEQNAYDQILQSGSAKVEGNASELADKLGFGVDMIIFTGFLDGIQTSLNKAVELDDIEDSTELELDIDFEKLFWNMQDAKADWLYNLESWDNVLSSDRRAEITRDFKESQIVRVEKIGRNDPCPCGSGKKYKQCCAKKQGAKL